MEQKHKATKTRIFAIGFFGWFLVGNLYNLVSTGLVIMFHDTLEIIPYFLDFLVISFSVVTVIVVGILVLKKRFRFVYGIVTPLLLIL